MTISSTDPSTGTTWAHYEPLTATELETKVARAASATTEMRTTSFAERRAICHRVADVMEARVDDLAELATKEMGKTLSSARAEVRKCSAGLRYYADNAEQFLGDEPTDATTVGATQAWVKWEPLGVILAVMPWNYPYWQAIRFLAPAYMAGNASLLKHASNVPGCALALQEVFTEAGAVAGAIQTLLVPASEVHSLINDPRIAAVTLTGSEGAGRAVGESAGRAIKKVVLELGGSDPFIVLPSADIETAATVAVNARFQNSGQSCIAAKRFIVHRSATGFVDAFVAATDKLIMGDPMNPETEVGPLATRSAPAELQALVDDAVRLGAREHRSENALPDHGWFYPPTILTGVTPEMRIFHEEAFGPVAAVMEVDSTDQAVALANATAFGLGASVWTTDEDEQNQVINEVEAGAVFVNGMTASYPQLPFGGIKTSGHGRELSYFGIREFCNAKTVWKA
jgi:succinate-semialdehyde dehydrogenase/glutarate-semialdehyde dehydrogenase